jgi:hypothetical protein
MTTVEQGSSGLIERVKNILLTPKTEWEKIDTEPATVKGLYIGYICILAAIGPIARLIGSQLFSGYSFLHFGLMAGVIGAVVGYIVSLVGTYVMALIIDALAPSFGGTKNSLQALKVVAYSWTASWLAGIFTILPLLGILALVGLYSLYLLYLGLPKLMKVPEDKALVYTIVSIVVACVVFVVIGMVTSAVVVATAGMGAVAAVG